VCRAHAVVRPAEGGATSNMGAAAGRTVAALQQKSHALNAELTRRRAAEGALLARDKAFADFVTNAVGALYRTCVGAGNLEPVRRERDDLLLRSPLAAALLGGPEHRFELANPLFEELLDRYKLAGKPFREAFPELVSTDLPALLDRAYDAGIPFVARASMFALHGGFAGARAATVCFTLIGQPFRQPWGAQWSTTVVALVDHDADNGRGAGITRGR
jgi:PAS domain-containing protein